VFFTSTVRWPHRVEMYCAVVRSRGAKRLCASRARLLLSGAPRSRRGDESRQLPAPTFHERGMTIDELIVWAWEHRRWDSLAEFGIYVTFDL
jgi:hypothetical protein